MYWQDVQQLSTGKFQRLVGVKRPTFEQMVQAVEQHYSQKLHRRGRPSRLSVQDQLLIMLMYYREYRTFFHIATTYGISEAQCWRIVRKMEDILIKSQLFHLPGKKNLQAGSPGEVVVIDVGESPVERPKKSKGLTTPVKRNAIP